MKTQFISYWSYLRTTFWFVPALMVAGAIVLFIAMDQIDRHVNVSRNVPWFYSGDAAGARQMMATIAGSMITIAGVAFSITIVALTLASNQFGPRILRSFMRDIGNQIVLGTFTAAFIYCILVLRQIRGGANPFIPAISVTVGVGLGLAGIAVLIYFVHHIASSIQANNVIAALSRDARHAIGDRFPQPLGEPVPPEPPPPEAVRIERERCVGREIPAGKNGYIQAVNNERLMSLAVEHDLLLRLTHRPGQFVGRQTVVAEVWPTERAGDDVWRALQKCFIVGPNRSLEQDFEFAIHQMVELGSRALSPSFNDPFTAITAVDHLGSILADVAQREMPSPYRRDGDRLRVIAPAVTFPELVDASLHQLRQYGRTHSAVMIRMLEVLAGLATKLRTDEQRQAVRHHVELIHRDALVSLQNPADTKQVEERYARALDELDGRRRTQRGERASA